MATSYDFDAQTLAVIRSLKETFGLRTSVAVIRRALQLAAVIAEHTNMETGRIVLGGKDGLLVQVAIQQF